MNAAGQATWRSAMGRGRVIDPEATSGERTYATFLHLTVLLIHIVLPVLPALVMWLVKKDQSPFLNDHGKEAVNFQISLLIYAVCAGVLMLVGIGVVLLPAVYILGIVGMVMGATAANRGEYFRYPMCLRLIG